MVQAEHDSVVDSVTVNQVVPSIHRCMFGHLSLSCQRPIRRYRLDLVEEILKTHERRIGNSWNLNHIDIYRRVSFSSAWPNFKFFCIEIESEWKDEKKSDIVFLDFEPLKSHISNATRRETVDPFFISDHSCHYCYCLLFFFSFSSVFFALTFVVVVRALFIPAEKLHACIYCTFLNIIAERTAATVASA